MIDNHIYIKVPRELALKVGFYLIDNNNNLYVTLDNYIIEIMPNPFYIASLEIVKDGIAVTLNVMNIASTIEAIAGITNEVHIKNSLLTFIITNDRLRRKFEII